MHGRILKKSHPMERLKIMSLWLMLVLSASISDEIGEAQAEIIPKG